MVWDIPWSGPEPGIAIPCNTVERVTRLEKQADEYKKRMSDSLEKLETKWKMESAGIPDSAGTRCYGLMLSLLENEDDEFLDELN